MPHWVYFLSAANAVVSLAAWRNLPLTVVRLVGALTKDPERSKRCAEILRLARKDAKDLPSYLIEVPGHDRAPATTSEVLLLPEGRPHAAGAGGSGPRARTADLPVAARPRVETRRTRCLPQGADTTVAGGHTFENVS